MNNESNLDIDEGKEALKSRQNESLRQRSGLDR
jgi:hypothetical protein